jgi:AI-2 transport protein TqsA
MATQPTIPNGLRFLLSAASLVIIVAGLRGARPILVPLALALFVAVVSLPLLNFARQKGTPTFLAILFVVLIDATALFMFGWLVTRVSVEITNELPAYLTRLQEIQDSLIAWFAARGIEVEEFTAVWFPGDAAAAGNGLPDLQVLFGYATTVFREATNLLAMTFLVILIFIFMLAEASSFPRKIRLIVGRDNEELGRSAKIVREIQHYLAIKTLISLATGLTIGVATWALGLDFPLLWGLLAFLLNYIPNVGSIIAAIPAVTVALLQIGPTAAILVAAVYMGVNALFGNFLEPMLVGRQLGISTLVIILSLVFWGWVWGPIGMFLSVPLTMALKIGLENSDDFRWAAVLMASDRQGRITEKASAPPVPSSSMGRRSKSPAA